MKELLAELNEKEMDVLPSGLSIYSLLQMADRGEGIDMNSTSISGSITGSPSALIQILSRVPYVDLLALQNGVRVASASYRYYQYNSSMGTNATRSTGKSATSS